MSQRPLPNLNTAMSDKYSDDLYAPSTTDPLIGTTIQNRYRIEKKLGQGGMGAVYLAEHILIQKKVAIKCLHAGLASNADLMRRFHNEALAATAIGHPNIVDVTDMGRFEDGTFFMALEFLPGRDWQHDLDATGAQPLERVAHIGMQICDALEAASVKGIVHRDLKPENIFLIDRHGDPDFVKVLDFGISKFHDGIGGGTRTGEIMGTPYYMAPEQIRGDKNISHIADIYALGVIFHQALAGEVPFNAETLPGLILKIATESAPELKAKLPDVPDPVNDLVRGMLSKTPHERPQTFSAVAQVLADYLADDSRLARTANRSSSLGTTSVGGTLDEPSKGEPAPDRPRNPTPVGARGQDTSAGGTPGMHFGKTEYSDHPVAKNDVDYGSTNEPHSMESVAPRAKSTASTALKAPLIFAALVLVAAAGWFVTRPAATVPAPDNIGPALDENRVRVQISTLPPDADLLLDGEPISNPFDGELTKDELTHELVIKREGFIETHKKMVLKSGQRIFVPLTAIAQSSDQMAKPIPSPVVSRPTRPERPASGTQPAPAPVAAPAPAPVPVPVAAPAPAPTPAPSDLKKIF